MTAWPTVPVQLHYAAKDPWIEIDDIRAFEAAVRAAKAPLEVHVYAGEAHLFADADLPEYDAGHARAMFERVTRFLAELP